MSRLEQLKDSFDDLCCSPAGRCLYKMLEGFAEILDNSEDVHKIDTDLVDIYTIIGLNNGTTIQITGQITDVELFEFNYVKLRTEDRKVGTMPNSTFIFRLNDIVTIQSLDIVLHQKRLEARMEKELTEQKEDTEKVSITKESKNKEAEGNA